MGSNLKLPGPKMIYIPGGTYMMGERGDVVTVGDFYMDETPVTVAQYREAVNAGACTPPEDFYKNEESNWGDEDRDDHPVNCVSWHQACAYAKWAGKRLPTEEEWEWAARGGNDGRIYPWGNEPPNDQLLCWNRWGEDKPNSTSPVGSYPKGDSKHGLKDLSGNVYEWTSSYHSTLREMINRGGGWGSSNSAIVRAANHYVQSNDLPMRRYSDLGFRCVRDA